MIHGILKCCFAVHFRLLMFTGTVLILSMFLPLLVVKGGFWPVVSLVICFCCGFSWVTYKNVLQINQDQL